MGYNKPLMKISISHVCATAQMDLGEERYDSQKHWVYAHNAGNSAVAPGYFVVPIVAGSGYSFTVTATTQADLPIGVVVNATAATADYCFLQTKGNCNLEAHADASFASGDLGMVAADGTVVKASAITDIIGPVVAKALSAVASGASGKFWINCR